MANSVKSFFNSSWAYLRNSPPRGEVNIFGLDFEIDAVIAKNRGKLEVERRRGYPTPRQSDRQLKKGHEQQSWPELPAGKISHYSYAKKKSLDLTYIKNSDLRHAPYWPTNEACDCDSCGGPIDEMDGFVLKNCSTHRICQICIFKEVSKPSPLKRCVVDHCYAPMKQDEIRAIKEKLENLNNNAFEESERRFENRTDESKGARPEFDEGTSRKYRCVQDGIPEPGTRPKNEGAYCRSSYSSSSFTKYSPRKHSPPFPSPLECSKCFALLTPPDLDQITTNPSITDFYCRKCLRSNTYTGVYNSQSFASLREPEERVEKSIGLGKKLTLDNGELDLDYLDRMGLRDQPIWRTNNFCKCANCDGFIKTLDGFILKNCRRHKVCRKCLFASMLELSRTCPLASCEAIITKEELDALWDLKTTEDSENNTKCIQEIEIGQEPSNSTPNGREGDPPQRPLRRNAKADDPKVKKIFCHVCKNAHPGENIRISSTCDHSFCENCVATSRELIKGRKCPICLKKLKGFTSYDGFMQQKKKGYRNTKC